MINPGDVAAAQRRSAASTTTATATPAAAPTSQSPDVDIVKKKRRRPPKATSRLVLETFAALSVAFFVLSRFFGVSILGGAGDASGGTGSRELNLDTKGGGPVGGKGAAPAVSDAPPQPPPPSWVLSLSDSPPNDGIPLHDGRYGTKLVTGRYAFRESPGCSLDSTGEKKQAPVACVAYYPEIDLSHHLDHEEALDARQQNKKGPNGPVVGHSVTIPRGSDDNVAVITRHGFKGAAGVPINQDRTIVVSPFLLSDDVSSPHDFLMGLFDGHGERGHAVAEWAMSEMPKELARRLSEINLRVEGVEDYAAARRAITETYHELDHRAADVSGSGCTATSVLRLGKKLYVINTGDSRSFVATYVASKAKTDISFISVEHKPDVKEEKERIEALGGTVMLPPKLPPGSRIKVSARVLAMLPNGMQLGLAMSRSIGDPEAAAFGVTATPTIDVLDIDEIRIKAAKDAGGGVSANDVQVFAVTASDGIYDHIEPEDVAAHISDSLYGGRLGGASLLQACEQLIMKSSERWINMGLDMVYRDDISIAVAKVLI